MAEDRYKAAADRARDAGVIDPHHLSRGEISSQMQRFLDIGESGTTGADELINEAVDRAMNQRVERAKHGTNFAARKNIEYTWTDTHGNLMAQRSDGERAAIVDKEDWFG